MLPTMTMTAIYDEWMRGELCWGEVKELVAACVTANPSCSLEPFDAQRQTELHDELERLANLPDDTTSIPGAERTVTEETIREMRDEFLAHRDGAREWLRRQSTCG